VDLANRLGIGKEFVHTAKGDWKQVPEDILREINTGCLAFGMIGQTPERVKRQHDWGHVFNLNNTRAESGPVKGEQWGLPWPCWTDKHPGTAILYRVDVPANQGGTGFRLRWGPKAPDGTDLIAGPSAAQAGSGIKGGYPEQDGWALDVTLKTIKEALAKGRVPFGNGRARFNAFGIPDPVPAHREPIHTPRPDLIAAWPTYDDVKDHFRVPTLYKSLQKPDWVKSYPIILTTGRQVEFEGGGNAERACWWLVELQPEMYCEIHPKLASDKGIKHGDWMWIESPEDLDGAPSKVKVKAKVTRRVGPDTVFLPFHWGGSFEGKSYAGKYPDGTVPYGIGESANVITNYGYDRVTQMQETKTGLCRIMKA
jgi:formate dehydrogenase major subunit